MHSALAVMMCASRLRLPVVKVELTLCVICAHAIAERSRGGALPLRAAACSKRRTLAVMVRARSLRRPLFVGAGGVRSARAIVVFPTHLGLVLDTLTNSVVLAYPIRCA